jgi:hypothetical protein
MDRVTSPRGRSLLLALLGALLCLAAGALAGCTSARNTLGTNSSPCYKAVPVAAGAVGHHGTFVGIRLLGARQVSAKPRLDALLDTRAPGVRNVCVAAYRGRFRPDEVERPFGPAPPGGSGPIAIVVVSSPQNRLIGTIVLARLPLRLRHEV